jgi:hypothetical protein
MTGYGFGAVSRDLNLLLVVAFAICGLVLTAAGVIVVKNDRPESDTTSLH